MGYDGLEVVGATIDGKWPLITIPVSIPRKETMHATSLRPDGVPLLRGCAIPKVPQTNLAIARLEEVLDERGVSDAEFTPSFRSVQQLEKEGRRSWIYGPNAYMSDGDFGITVACEGGFRS